MGDFLKTKSFKFLVLIFALVCLLFAVDIASGFSLTHSAIAAVVTPMQKVAVKVFGAAGNVVKAPKTSSQYEEEIASLKKEIVNLRTLLIDYSNLKNQNEQYSEYLKIKKENESLKFVPAEVIGRDPNEDLYGFTIDKGTKDGISVHDPVMTANGVVGWISSVDAVSSHVKSVLSPETKIGALCKTKKDSGVIIGNIKVAAENCARLCYISSQTTMCEGDIIVTSGVGGIYPRDLLIGKVKSLSNDEYDSSRYATIEFFENSLEVKDVFVVTDFNGKGTVDTRKANEIFPGDGK